MKGFNSKIWIFGAIATILLIAIIMPSVPSASSVSTTLCDDAKIDSGVFGNVVVIPGLDCSLNEDVIVTGNILIESGASFSANNISIGGNIESDGASFISLSGVTVDGNIQIENSNVGPVITIIRSVIDGNIQFENNVVTGGSIIIFGNTINGNVEFSDNTSSNNFIGRNTINKNLECNNNTPSPVIIRGLNTVTGNISGQCVGL